MQLMCGSIFINHFITHFQQNVPVNFFENRSMFLDDMDKSLRLNCLSHPVQQTHSWRLEWIAFQRPQRCWLTAKVVLQSCANMIYISVD